MSNCRPELLRSQFHIANSEKQKLRIDADNLLDRLSIAAIASKLYAEDPAADTPKVDFSANKILEERFFYSLSNGIQDDHSKLLFVVLRFAEYSSFNSR